MAQLGNTVVNGSLRVIGDFYANGYIDTTVTLTSSGWSGTDLFTQTVKVAGVKADNNYRVYQYISSGATAAEIKTYLKNFSYVVSGYATPADGSITFTTIKKPTANVTVRIVGDSNVERTTVENSEVTSMKSDIASINTSLNTLNTRIYPVGSIYISVNNTNPATIFGGTWEQIKDRFLLSAGNSYIAGSTGGESTHTLTINEMPSHSHQLNDQDAHGAIGSLQGGGGYSQVNRSADTTYWWSSTHETGSSQPHNNMPPYLTVYMWKRTA